MTSGKPPAILLTGPGPLLRLASAFIAGVLVLLAGLALDLTGPSGSFGPSSSNSDDSTAGPGPANSTLPTPGQMDILASALDILRHERSARSGSASAISFAGLFGAGGDPVASVSADWRLTGVTGASGGSGEGRMAVINGRIYGVGQALPDSSRLESIDATGVWLTSSMGRLRLELERSTPPRLVRGPERMDNASVSVPDIRETPQVTPRPDALAVLDDVRRRLAEGGAVNATIIGRASDDRPGVRLKSDVQGAGY